MGSPTNFLASGDCWIACLILSVLDRRELAAVHVLPAAYCWDVFWRLLCTAAHHCTTSCNRKFMRLKYPIFALLVLSLETPSWDAAGTQREPVKIQAKNVVCRCAELRCAATYRC